MISILKEIVGSLTKALDIIYVLESSKPVTRILYDEENKELFNFLSEKNLYYELSDFKILKHTDTTRSYSDKGIRISKDDKRKGLYFLYIARDKKLVKEARELEGENNNFELGKLLGYPECCCSFFDKYSEIAAKTTNDLTLYTFKESKGHKFPWQNNFCLRCFDISLISHFPCSFDCEKSRQIAMKNSEIIKKYDTDITRYFSNALKSAVLYSEGVGVYNFTKFKINNRMMEYHPGSVIASSKNDLYNILKRRNRLTILGKNTFLIGEVRIEDAQTFFGVFS